MDWEKRLKTTLERRENEGLKRGLELSTGLVDFASNDYLGLSRNTDLQAEVYNSVAVAKGPLGSGGSRLLTGNSALAMEVEALLASFFNVESTLLFNSGYAANTGLLSAIPRRGDTIIYDELSHACIKDGVRLSPANYFAFRHNDVDDLRKKVSKAKGNLFIVAESVYSMDGDTSPLNDIVGIAREAGACIILDEAHGLGVIGKDGKGLAAEMGITDDIIARVFTFGKAMGSHGACIAGSQTLIDYLINFSRPFIYTTALPFHSLITLKQAFSFFEKNPGPRHQLSDNISYFNKVLTQNSGLFVEKVPGKGWLPSESAIQAMIYPGNDEVRKLARYVQDAGYDVRPILSPTVKKGFERLRVCLHAFNSRKEIDGLLNTIKQHNP